MCDTEKTLSENRVTNTETNAKRSFETLFAKTGLTVNQVMFIQRNLLKTRSLKTQHYVAWQWQVQSFDGLT